MADARLAIAVQANTGQAEKAMEKLAKTVKQRVKEIEKTRANIRMGMMEEVDSRGRTQRFGPGGGGQPAGGAGFASGAALGAFAKGGGISQVLGKGSAIGQFGSLLKGGGIIAGAQLVAHQIDRIGTHAHEAAESFDKMETAGAQMVGQLGKGIPILGRLGSGLLQYSMALHKVADNWARLPIIGAGRHLDDALKRLDSLRGALDISDREKVRRREESRAPGMERAKEEAATAIKKREAASEMAAKVRHNLEMQSLELRKGSEAVARREFELSLDEAGIVERTKNKFLEQYDIQQKIIRNRERQKQLANDTLQIEQDTARANQKILDDARERTEAYKDHKRERLHRRIDEMNKAAEMSRGAGAFGEAGGFTSIAPGMKANMLGQPGGRPHPVLDPQVSDSNKLLTSIERLMREERGAIAA